MPHKRHIYAKASDMAKATMCAYPQSDNALPHCKCVFRCCSRCPHINLPVQETNKKYEETTPSIRFHIYHIIGRCTAHGIIPLKDKKYVTCVNKNLHQINLQNIHQKRASDDEDNDILFSYQFLHTSHQKVDI